jgi:hypothetical protein
MTNNNGLRRNLHALDNLYFEKLYAVISSQNPSLDSADEAVRYQASASVWNSTKNIVEREFYNASYETARDHHLIVVAASIAVGAASYIASQYFGTPFWPAPTIGAVILGAGEFHIFTDGKLLFDQLDANGEYSAKAASLPERKHNKIIKRLDKLLAEHSPAPT